MTVYIKTKYYLRKIVYVISGLLLSLIPKKKGLVLFTSWFGQKYVDNTKYVFEYFVHNTEYNPIWLTRNREIYSQLRRERKPVELSTSIKGIWNQIRAEAVFSTVQFADYNTWLLTHCIYIDLGHGHPIKDPGFVIKDEYLIRVTKDILKRINYFAIVAGTKTKINYNVVPVTQDHIFVSDFARNDVLINSKLRDGKNTIIEGIKKGRKAIVYMPTHRSDGKIAMPMNKILDLDAIEKFCTDTNCVFIIKKHFYHRNESEKLECYPHIFDITNIDDIDPQVLLCQADLLISDYSACFIDYMLLRRPIIFYQYDIEDFKNKERTLYYNFEELDIAPIVYNKFCLVDSIEKIIKNGDSWLDRRMLFARDNYFDNLNQENGCEKVKEVFEGVYKKYFN